MKKNQQIKKVYEEFSKHPCKTKFVKLMEALEKNKASITEITDFSRTGKIYHVWFSVSHYKIFDDLIAAGNLVRNYELKKAELEKVLTDTNMKMLYRYGNLSEEGAEEVLNGLQSDQKIPQLIIPHTQFEIQTATA